MNQPTELKSAEEWMMEFGKTKSPKLQIGSFTLPEQAVTILTAGDIGAIQLNARIHELEWMKSLMELPGHNFDRTDKIVSKLTELREGK